MEEITVTELKQLKDDNLFKTFTDVQDAAYMTIISKNNIYLYSNITDIYPVRYLHNIRTINIENCNIENLSSIGYCNNLTELTISGLTNIKDFSCLHNIEFLGIYNCDMIDIHSTRELSKLHTLRLTGCYTITQLSLLKFTPNLMMLRINNCNELHDISHVTNLSKLYSLDLMNCNMWAAADDDDGAVGDAEVEDPTAYLHLGDGHTATVKMLLVYGDATDIAGF